MKRSLRERLYARLVPDPETGCLLWTGARNTPNGYGWMRVNRRNVAVHRLAWELENGPIPEGLVIDHVRARGCRYNHCANVAHLEPVTQRENILRGTSPIAINASKTHCVNGHEFDQVNTYVAPRGSRDCRECKRASDQRRSPRHRHGHADSAGAWHPAGAQA